ncbi:MAG TPA: hypothetical protein VE046_04480 [Steroidobacteraceae bacterium]|nr:hypothetical protein [Steroidobacteraceae bacterium]
MPLRTVPLAVIACLALFATAIYARGNADIVDYRDVPVRTGTGKAMIQEQVCSVIVEAIGKARAAGRYPWIRTTEPDGSMIATAHIQSKHMVRVNIRCAADKYSVTYRDSENMNYELHHGVATIHPYYNRWVQELVTAIDMELAHN